MRIHIVAVGRMKNGPEKLLSDYSGRFDKLAHGLTASPLPKLKPSVKRQISWAELIRAFPLPHT